MASGNKGEWSEFYAFLKLIVDQKLNSGGPDFKTLEGVFTPVLKIIRTERGGNKVYELNNKKVRITNQDKVTVVDVSDLKNKIKVIFKAISETAESAFEIPESEEIMSRLQAQTLSAGNKLKEDLTLQIHDDVTRTDPEVGFSIKSLVGNAATLLNASKATNFVFRVVGLSLLDAKIIKKINTQERIRDRLKMIYEKGGRIEYVRMDSAVFEANLRLADSILPEIVAQMLFLYYSGKASALGDLIDEMIDSGLDVRGFKMDRVGYEHKIQNLLHNAALGMVPGTPWDGFMRAHGGYIIVRGDGELVGYNVYNADVFRKYLLNGTKLDTPSTTRHEFGTFYAENKDLLIKLNLQIRFND